MRTGGTGRVTVKGVSEKLVTYMQNNETLWVRLLVSVCHTFSSGQFTAALALYRLFFFFIQTTAYDLTEVTVTVIVRPLTFIVSGFLGPHLTLFYLRYPSTISTILLLIYMF